MLVAGYEQHVRWVYGTMGTVGVLVGGAIAINFIAAGSGDTDCGCWWLFAGYSLLGFLIVAFGIWLLRHAVRGEKRRRDRGLDR